MIQGKLLLEKGVTMNFGRTYLRILAVHNAIADLIAFLSRPLKWLASLRLVGSSSQLLIRHARRGRFTLRRLEPHRR
jgi:hypothetical protein